MFVKNCSVCPLYTFPALSKVFEKNRSLPEWNTFQLLHSRVGPLSYQQTLYKAGKVYQDTRSSLLCTFINYDRKFFQNIVPSIWSFSRCYQRLDSNPWPQGYKSFVLPTVLLLIVNPGLSFRGKYIWANVAAPLFWKGRRRKGIEG